MPISPNRAQVEHQLVSDVIGAQDRLSVALDGVADDFDEVIEIDLSTLEPMINGPHSPDRAHKVSEVGAHAHAEGWPTEGWWNIASKTCETLLKGAVPSRFVYVHAIDYDRGGEWGGKAPLEMQAEAKGDEPVVVILQHEGPASILAAAALR